MMRGGSYNLVRLSGGARTGRVTFRGTPGEDVVIEQLTIAAAGQHTVERVRVRGSIEVDANTRDARIARTRVERGITLQEGVRDFTLENSHVSNTTGYGLVFSAATGDPEISGVRVVHNLFEDIGVDAIQAKRFRGLVIESNEFTRVGTSGLGGHPDVVQTYLGGADLTFRNNYVHDVIAQGVFVKDGQVTGLAIESNLLVRVSGGFYSINLYDAPGARVVNNTVWGGGGVMLRATLSAADIRNNIFSSLASETGATVTYQGHNVLAGGNRRGLGDGDILGSPLFVDPTATGSDFRLQSASRGIDEAISEGAPARDILGRVRRSFHGNSTGALALGAGAEVPDIGAYEYVEPGSADDATFDAPGIEPDPMAGDPAGPGDPTNPPPVADRNAPVTIPPGPPTGPTTPVTPTPTTPAPIREPRLTVRLRGGLKLTSTPRAVLTIACDRACSPEVSATVAIGSGRPKRISVQTSRRALASAGSRQVTVSFSAKQMSAALKKLERGESLKVSLTVGAEAGVTRKVWFTVKPSASTRRWLTAARRSR